MNQDTKKVEHLTKFSESEEQTIAQILIYFAETNFPLNRAHLKQFILKLRAWSYELSRSVGEN